jgi:DNA repair photolyase
MPNTAPIDNTTWKCPTTYKVSCNTTSRVLLARITPLTPPIVKRIMNLLDHNVIPVILILMPTILASQLNTLMELEYNSPIDTRTSAIILITSAIPHDGIRWT